MEQLSVAEGKLGNVMTRLLGVDIFNKKLEMDEERWSWSMLFMAIDPIVGHIQLITFVHPNQQVCPWGTRIQDRPLWRGAREEEGRRGQRTRGGGGANPGIPEAAVQPDSWRKESKQARGKETLVDSGDPWYIWSWYHLVSTVVTIVNYKKKKHFVPVLPGIVPLSGWWTIWLKPCPYFPSIFIHFYPRPSIMWQLWKCPLKSDQNLDTS